MLILQEEKMLPAQSEKRKILNAESKVEIEIVFIAKIEQST